jgi:hypothetical protein
MSDRWVKFDYHFTETRCWHRRIDGENKTLTATFYVDPRRKQSECRISVDTFAPGLAITVPADRCPETVAEVKRIVRESDDDRATNMLLKIEGKTP